MKQLDEASKLYAEQMSAWFKEHKRIEQQLSRTIDHYNELAHLNARQLEIHNRRLELCVVEYNQWAKENGAPEYKDDESKVNDQIEKELRIES